MSTSRNLESLLSRLDPASPKAILTRLWTARQRLESGEDLKIPELTVYLLNGLQFRGSLVRMTGEGIVLLLDSEARHVAPSLAWARVDDVAAVVVHDLDRINSLVTAAPTVGEAPSPLQLKRKAAEFGQTMLEALGSAVSVTIPEQLDSVDARRTLGYLLEDLQKVLAGICRDSVGQDALRGHLVSILLERGQPGCRRDEGRFVVTADWTPGLVGRPSREEIQQSIEKLF